MLDGGILNLFGVPPTQLAPFYAIGAFWLSPFRDPVRGARVENRDLCSLKSALMLIDDGLHPNRQTYPGSS